MLTSQMYERFNILSIRQSWNCMIAKATASFFPPSGYHEMFDTVRFTVLGSLRRESRGVGASPGAGVAAGGRVCGQLGRKRQV